MKRKLDELSLLVSFPLHIFFLVLCQLTLLKCSYSSDFDCQYIIKDRLFTQICWISDRETCTATTLHMYCRGYETCLLDENNTDWFPCPLFSIRIHGSVDCLSELSSSRLSHPLAGEPSLILSHTLASLAYSILTLKALYLCIIYEHTFSFVFLLTYRHTPEFQHINSHFNAQGAKSQKSCQQVLYFLLHCTAFTDSDNQTIV